MIALVTKQQQHKYSQSKKELQKERCWELGIQKHSVCIWFYRTQDIHLTIYHLMTEKYVSFPVNKKQHLNKYQYNKKELENVNIHTEEYISSAKSFDRKLMKGGREV